MSKLMKASFKLLDLMVIFAMIFGSPMSVLAAPPAQTSTIYLNPDSGGENDIDPSALNNQSDLSAYGVNGTGAANSSTQYGWKWDEAYLSGSNSQDVCVYLSSTASGQSDPNAAEYAVCYHVITDSTGNISTEYVDTWYCPTYATANASTGGQKCYGNSTTTLPAGVTIAVNSFDLTSNVVQQFSTDPDLDSQVILDVTANLDLELINICSKKSESPASDSSDCGLERAPAFLKLVKVVQDGTAVPGDWTLYWDGPAANDGSVLGNNTQFVPVPDGTYTLSESSVPDYEQVSLVCSPIANTGNSVTLTQGVEETCTFTNKLSFVPAPSMTVDKSSTTTSLSAAGTVTYDYLVTNTGNVTLTGIVLSDNNDNDDMVCESDTLAAGASMTCTATHTFTQTELDANGSPTAGSGVLYNLVAGDSNETEPVTDELTITIVKNAAMTVEKSSTTTSLSAPGTVTYDYLVTNTGNVTLTGISLSDDNDNDDMVCESNTLAVGASMTCAATHTFIQAELDSGGTLDNTVTADSNETEPVTDDLSIPITKNAAMTVEKSSETTSLSAPGTVNYSYLVKNTGNVTLTGISLSDDNDNDDMVCESDTLAAGASMTCTATHTFTQTELDANGSPTAGSGVLYNLVTADSNETEPVTDELTITIVKNAAMTVEKSSTTTSLSAPGTVTYDYLVTNTGNVTLTGISLSDDNDNDDMVCESNTLAVGASMTCTATHTFTQAELDAGGSLDNVVTASSNEAPDVTDDLSIPISQSASLTIDKTGTFDAGLDGFAQPGELISYEFVVTNVGNVTLTGITVTDPLIGLSAISCPQDTLAVGESMTCTGTYAVTQADIEAGFVYNIATADSNETEPETDDHNQPLPQNPDLTIDKTGTFDAGADGFAQPGELISYEFVVTNVGNVTLTGITVTDPLIGLSAIVCPADTLAVGESMTCTGTYAVTQADIDAGSVYNLATADSTQSEPDTDDETEALPQNHALSVDKSASPEILPEPGGLVTFTVRVNNTGNTTLNLTSLLDNIYGDIADAANPKLDSTVCAVPQTILVGEFYECTFKVDLTGEPGLYTDTVTATANNVTASDDAAVTITDVMPDISITKTADPTSVPETGGNVTFTFLVENIGVEDVTLTSLTDSVFGDLNGQGDCVTGGLIPVGASYSCSITVFLSSDSLTNHYNMVTAIGTDDDGTTDEATDDETVTFDDVAPMILVTKTANPTSVPETGGDVTFTITAKNVGTEPVTLIGAVDTIFGPIDVSLFDKTYLLVGETATYSFVELMAGEPGMPHENVVTVTAEDNEGTDATGSDDADVTYTDVAPAIRITKTASPNHVPETGGDVTFTFLVENIGVEDVTLTELTDTVFGDLDSKGTCDVPQTVLIGGSYTCEYTVNLSSDSLTAHYNVSTATAVDDDNTPATDDDDETVTFDDVAPDISISKTADPTHVPETGGNVTFTFVVTNDGVEDVTLTSLNDTKFGDLNGQGDCVTGGLIPVGGSYSCSITVFLSSDSLTAHYNVVTVVGTDDDGTTDTATDNETVTFDDVAPQVKITKTANPTYVLIPGGNVTFTFLVENIGVEDVTLISLNDTKFGDLDGKGTCDIPQTILIGGSYSCTYTTFIGSATATTHTNVVTATAVDDDGTTATDDDNATVDILATTSKIAPTQTTCQQYRDGTALDYTELMYNVSKGTIQSVAPGVIFFWSTITAPSSSFSLEGHQFNDSGALAWRDMANLDVFLWDANCDKVQTVTLSFNNEGHPVLDVTDATAGATYYFSVKYNSNSLTGILVKKPYPTVNYTFQTMLDGALIITSPDSIAVKPKK